MRFFILYLILFSIIHNKLFSKNEFNNWYFGDSAAITFSTKDGNPVSLTNSNMWALEGCASISDTNGNLLFYSNGENVWNRRHEIMPNGSGLFGHFHATQAALIVPQPGTKDIYYIFTSGISGTRDSVEKGIHYSIIDMNLDNGNGDITQKNIEILRPAPEKLVATKHKNGIDYWIIMHEYNSSVFHSYLLTKDGLIPNPVKTDIGTVHDLMSGIGYMKVSMDSKKIALTMSVNDRIELFDFDNSTGKLSNFRFIEFPGQTYDAYGLEFSPNSKYLFTCYAYEWGYRLIVRYDITLKSALDITKSEKSLSIITDGFVGAFQTGPDHNIYFIQYDKPYVGTIINPDDIVTGNIVILDAIKLDRGKGFYGLPNCIFTKSDFNVEIDASDICEGDTLFIYPDVTANSDDIVYQWSGPDNFSSTKENVIIPDAGKKKEGLYILTVTAGSNSKSDSAYIHVCPNPKVSITPEKEKTICRGEEVKLQVKDYTPGLIYYWSTGDTSLYINVKESDTYIITAENEFGCKARDTFRLTVKNSPDVKIEVKGNNYLCEGDSVILKAVVPFGPYQISWSNGEKQPQIIVKETGTYVLTVEDLNTGCSNSDSVFIEVFDFIPVKIKTSTGKHVLCDGSSIQLSVEPQLPGFRYQWNNGDTTPSIEISNHGTYIVAVSLNDKCFAYDTVNIQLVSLPDFTLLGNRTICKGGSSNLKVSNEYPQYHWSTGASSRDITIYEEGTYSVTVYDTNGCSNTLSVEIKEINVDIQYPSEIHFDTICVGEIQKKEVIIYNNSEYSVIVDNYVVSGLNSSYEIKLDSNEIKPFSSIRMSIEFVPESVGLNDAIVRIEYTNPCRQESIIELNGTANAKTILKLPDTYTAVGQRVNIPLLLNMACGKKIDKSESYNATISFDKYALIPLCDNIYTFDKGFQGENRVIEINNSVELLQSDSILFHIPFYVLSSEKESIPLIIEQFDWDNNLISKGTRNGNLYITRICNPALSKIKFIDSISMSIQPNPASNNATIKLTGIKSGWVEVKIYSVSGTLIERYRILKEKIDYVLDLDLKRYSTGIYQVVMQIGEVQLTERLVVSQ